MATIVPSAFSRSALSRRALLTGAATALGSRVTSFPVAAATTGTLTAPPVTLANKIVWPADPAYETARLTFNRRFSRYPAAIVSCSTGDDIAAAVRWARQNDWLPCARSGGHGYTADAALDDALLIDLAQLNTITIDPTRSEATIGPGAHLLDIATLLGNNGFALPAGSCPFVGIGGLTLGGGVGFLQRQFGLTCDNLLAARVIDASGALLLANDTDNPDLFWALRGGGGGNFGIVSEFTFRVHPIGPVAMYAINWNWSDAAAVIAAWQDWAPFADHRLGSVLTVVPPTAGGATSVGVFNGSEAELWDCLPPLLNAAAPTSSSVWTTDWLSAVNSLAAPAATRATFKNNSAFVDTALPARAIASLLDALAAAPATAPGTDPVIALFAFGGAVNEIAPNATAFVHRRALFDLQYQVYWSGEAPATAAIAWVNGARDAMLPFASGAYVNYLDDTQPDPATAYYGSNLRRLQRIKARYDPDNVFHGLRAIPALPG